MVGSIYVILVFLIRALWFPRRLFLPVYRIDERFSVVNRCRVTGLSFFLVGERAFPLRPCLHAILYFEFRFRFRFAVRYVGFLFASRCDHVGIRQGVSVGVVTWAFRREVFEGRGHSVRVTNEPPVGTFAAVPLRFSGLSVNCADEGDSACVLAVRHRCLFVDLYDVAGERVGFYVGVLPARSHATATSSATASGREFGRVERPFTSNSKGSLAVQEVPVHVVVASSGTKRSAAAADLLADAFLDFGLVNVLPIFAMFVMFLALLQITRRFVYLVSLLGLVLYA